MKKLYNRIMTMGMISTTAILAWVYCLINYKDNLLYIGILSVVLVMSVYALLIAIAGLKTAKEEILMRYITDTVNQGLSRITPSDNNTDMERIAKASYVQQRKHNTILTKLIEAQASNTDLSTNKQTELNDDLKELISYSIGKGVKVLVKYNQVNNEKLIDTVTQLNEQLASVTAQLNEVTAELNTVKGGMTNTDNIEASYADVIPFPSGNVSAAHASEPEPVKDEAVVEKASVIDEPVVEEETSAASLETADANKMLSPDEIAALFAAAAPASEPEPVIEEETVNEEPAPSLETADSNKMLSPDEIAALFASAAPASEPEPVVEEETVDEEPAFSPVTADANKKLSPDEIAALFAAAAPSSEPEPVKDEVVEEEPVASIETADANKMLSPDEIAALFASIGAS